MIRKSFILSFCLFFIVSFATADTVLRRGGGAEPGSVDPHHITGDWESGIVGDMFMGLTTEAADGKIIPGLAKSWHISKDGKVYTFTMRRQAKWSDGRPVVAGDFVYSFKRILNPKTAAKYAFMLYPIKNAEEINRGKAKIESLGVRAIDTSTLEIRLKGATPQFLQQLAHFTMYAVPRQSIERYGDAWTKPENIVVSGAFILDTWQPQSYVLLRKNPLFFDAKNVSLDAVKYYNTEDLNAELKRYRAKELDITFRIPSGQFPHLKKQFDSELRIAPQLAIYYYAIRNIEKFKDIRVRKALSLAINRDVIVKKILREGQVAAYSMVPPGTNNYPVSPKPHLSFKGTPYRENLAKARALMEQAGYNEKTPLSVQIKYNTDEGHKKVAVAIAAMWKQIGIKATLFNQEATVHAKDLQEGNFEVGRAGWIGDYNDPMTFDDLFLDVSHNYPKWIDKNLIAKVEKANAVVDMRKRAEILAEVEQMALDSYFYMPIYYYVSKHLVSKDVIGYEGNIMDIHRSRWLRLR